MKEARIIALLIATAASAEDSVERATAALAAAAIERARPYTAFQNAEIVKGFERFPALAEAYLAASASPDDTDARAKAFAALDAETRTSPDGRFLEAMFGAAPDSSPQQIALLEECANSSPEHVLSRFHLGRVFRKSDPTKAERIARELILIHPAGYGMLSDLLHMRGDLDGEIEATRAFIKAGGAPDLGIPASMAEEKLPALLAKQNAEL